MSIYDKVYKAYTDSQKNGLWDAWGIVANPKMIYELGAECMEKMVVFNGSEQTIDSIFGLVLIPCEECDAEIAYVVDEQLGRTILGRRKGAANDNSIMDHSDSGDYPHDRAEPTVEADCERHRE